jgi:hypothetical protein
LVGHLSIRRSIKYLRIWVSKRGRINPDAYQTPPYLRAKHLVAHRTGAVGHVAHVHQLPVLLQGLGGKVGLVALLAGVGPHPGMDCLVVGQVALVVEGLAAGAAPVFRSCGC